MNKYKALCIHAHMINMDVTLRIRIEIIFYHTNVIVTVQLIIAFAINPFSELSVHHLYYFYG